ncbi:hypothetical protein ACFX1Z_024769 [Malus domestica]
MTINLKYIYPTYMIRAIPSNASDNVYCTLLAHSAIHGVMVGYMGFAVGPVNERHAYIPFHPSFLDLKEVEAKKKEDTTKETKAQLMVGENHIEATSTSRPKE